MRHSEVFWLCVLFSSAMTVCAGDGDDGWETYRNGEFGYEISYPVGMTFEADSGGESGSLVETGGGQLLARLEVWPPSECLVDKRERTEAVAREVGIRRAEAMTQADGHGSSSYCGDPVTVRDFLSRHGVVIYELELTCVNEEYPDAGDDEEDVEPQAAEADAAPRITIEGKKGPTFFADISQPWLKRVLLADPAGVDPRRGEKDPGASADLRRVLATLKTFPVPKPEGACIQDLR